MSLSSSTPETASTTTPTYACSSSVRSTPVTNTNTNNTYHSYNNNNNNNNNNYKQYKHTMAALPLYEDSLGVPLAKRPRVDYNTNCVEARLGPSILLPPQLVELQLAKKTTEGEQPNHVLLFTVLNPTYPVTCDLLHTIASPFGKLLRVVIFKKNGVQAMLEFDSLESAKRAKDSLHGCDIYSGCCTLKIEYAKPTKLNVYKNDTESFDFTNPNLGKGGLEAGPGAGAVVAGLAPPQRPVLLKDPGLGAGQDPGVGPLAVALRPAHPHPGHMFAPAAGPHQVTSHPVSVSPALSVASLPSALPGGVAGLLSPAHHLTRLPSPPALPVVQPGPAPVSPVGGAVGVAASGSGSQSAGGSSVTMVYGVNCSKMSCSRIFNIFCLYGNVVRVKFLKTKEGCAMVQMGDSLAVERVVTNLNNVTFFESKMQLGFSKQAFLADVQQPYELPDGSPSFMDFMGNKNNRFINPEMAAKNRIQPPSKILHFFNTPPGLEAADIEEIFTSHGTPRPKCIKMFPSKTDRSSSGLIEFESLSEALESLVTANHIPVDNPSGKFPYIMKLCFSSSKAIPAVIH